MNDLLTGKSIGIVAIANNILNQLKACQGQTKDSFNSDVHPSLRKLFEDEELRRCIYCSATEADANKASRLSLKVLLTLRFLSGHWILLQF